MTTGFNSLQTGRYMESDNDGVAGWSSAKFQFPSNGKVQGKLRSLMHCSIPLWVVSIPFKREGTWKVAWQRKNYGSWSYSFNSLQTGRYMERNIPAGRENLVLGFQFPSNGKVHGKCRQSTSFPWVNLIVSIPFKREGTWKDEIRIPFCLSAIVSIPFKREGTWKAVRERRTSWRQSIRHSFNSLQTGRYMESPGGTTDRHEKLTFQFPSNGKVHGKQRSGWPLTA